MLVSHLTFCIHLKYCNHRETWTSQKDKKRSLCPCVFVGVCCFLHNKKNGSCSKIIGAKTEVHCPLSIKVRSYKSALVHSRKLYQGSYIRYRILGCISLRSSDNSDNTIKYGHT